MKPPADFHPFLIDASWYEAYWYGCEPSKNPDRIGGFPMLTALLRRFRAMDWRHLSDGGRNDEAAGHI